MSATPEGQAPEQEGHGPVDDPRWLDRPENVNKIVWALVAVSAATVLADLFYHKHGHWHFQEWMGFDALYGFVACVGLVLAAKGLRVLLMRDENFYGDLDEAPPPPASEGGGPGHD